MWLKARGALRGVEGEREREMLICGLLQDEVILSFNPRLRDISVARVEVTHLLVRENCTFT